MGVRWCILYACQIGRLCIGTYSQKNLTESSKYSGIVFEFSVYFSTNLVQKYNFASKRICFYMKYDVFFIHFCVKRHLLEGIKILFLSRTLEAIQKEHNGILDTEYQNQFRVNNFEISRQHIIRCVNRLLY